MAAKYLTSKSWNDFIKKNKLKDPGIGEQIKQFWDNQAPAFEDRLRNLEKIVAMATKMKKDKTVAAEKANVEHLTGLLAECAATVKATKSEQKKHEAEAKKSGMREVNVQFVIKNFLGEPMLGYKALIEFKAPGTDTVTLGQPIKGGVVGFKEIELAPQGAMRLMALSTGKAQLAPSGVCTYKLSGKSISFTAEQESKTIKVKAASMAEMTKKAGLKGTAGLEFQVLKVGGEAYTEAEGKKGRSEEVEWEVKLATSTFKVK